MDPQEKEFTEKLTEIDALMNTDVQLSLEKAKLLFNEARKLEKKILKP